MLRLGDFYDVIEEIIDYVAGDPVLVLIDPFGLKDLHLEPVAKLANSSPMCDLVVTFSSPAAPRLEARHGDYLARALGPGSDDEEPAARFGRNMSEIARFLGAGRFPIRQRIDSRLKYELMFFARVCDGYQISERFLDRRVPSA
jgi:hypothetical protein